MLALSVTVTFANARNDNLYELMNKSNKIESYVMSTDGLDQKSNNSQQQIHHVAVELCNVSSRSCSWSQYCCAEFCYNWYNAPRFVITCGKWTCVFDVDVSRTATCRRFNINVLINTILRCYTKSCCQFKTSDMFLLLLMLMVVCSLHAQEQVRPAVNAPWRNYGHTCIAI